MIQIVLTLLFQPLHCRLTGADDRVMVRGRLRDAILGLGGYAVRLVEHECHGASTTDAQVLRAHICRAQSIQITGKSLQDGGTLFL